MNAPYFNPNHKPNIAETIENGPSPANFEVFLPWVCTQLQIPVTPIITKIKDPQNDAPLQAGASPKMRKITKTTEDVTEVDIETGGTKTEHRKFNNTVKIDSIVYIHAIYDSADNLVQLKFCKNMNIPRALLKVMSLILPFYPRLTTIQIDRGLKQGGLYELSKLVVLSKITEVVLDNTVLLEANYYLLLDNNTCLKYLSLARCKLNDSVVTALTSRLNTTSPASKTLSVLNLSSNRITDVGAKYIGDTLRVNRQLSYLNLAGNLITDKGADSILSSLMKFTLTADEIRETRAKHLAYLREKNDLIMKIVREMRAEDMDRKNKRKGKKSKAEQQDSSVNMDAIWYEKAEASAEAVLGPFKDGFRSDNLVTKDGQAYCLGNNILCYLNLSYNNLTYFSVKKLYEVLCFQNNLNRNPKGLISVCIEGNNIPEPHAELSATG